MPAIGFLFKSDRHFVNGPKRRGGRRPAKRWRRRKGPGTAGPKRTSSVFFPPFIFDSMSILFFAFGNPPAAVRCGLSRTMRAPRANGGVLQRNKHTPLVPPPPPIDVPPSPAAAALNAFVLDIERHSPRSSPHARSCQPLARSRPPRVGRAAQCRKRNAEMSAILLAGWRTKSSENAETERFATPDRVAEHFPSKKTGAVKNS